MNYYLKVIKNGKVIDKCQTHSIRRFLKNLRTIKWENGDISTHLRISYDRYEDNFGKLTEFYNDGLYENKEDLWLAFKAFTENET